MPANPNNWMAFFLNNSAENNRSKAKSALIQSNKSLKTLTHLCHNPAKKFLNPFTSEFVEEPIKTEKSSYSDYYNCEEPDTLIS